jgi:hypothetical protein
VRRRRPLGCHGGLAYTVEMDNDARCSRRSWGAETWGHLWPAWVTAVERLGPPMVRDGIAARVLLRKEREEGAEQTEVGT